MSVTGFLGMRGTGDWATDQRPRNWREMILRLFPSGSAPLTAIMSRLRSETSSDPEFNWWDKLLADQGGTVTDIFIDDLSTSYVRATHQATFGIAGGTIQVQLPDAATSNHFTAGQEIVLRDASRSDVDVIGEVTSVVKNGANSKLLVELVQADTQTADTANFSLATVDRVLIIGNAHAEGAEMPNAVSYDPNKRTNFTQIFRNSLSITRTAQQTRLRTGDAYQEEKLETLQYHGIEMDRAFIFGEQRETTDSASGKQKRFTRGILNWIRSDSNATDVDYRFDSTVANGATWISGGENWLDDNLEPIFRFNETKELLGLCGSGALQGINRLAKVSGQVNIEPISTVFGLQVVTWVTPFGRIQLMTHPLFSYVTEDRFRIIIGDPRRLTFRFITDTMFKEDRLDEGGSNSKDARDEEYLTEAGLELHHTRSWGNLDGVGKDNTN